jgi:NADP-dependent 3-hydroxy acid dehydrogenase YdfG
MNIKQKVALISGGTTGIGKAMAYKLLEEGYGVCVFSNVAEDRKIFLDDVKGLFGKESLQVLAGDITSDSSVKQVVKEVVKKFKKIDVLINNAGMGYFVSAEDVDLDKYDKMMEVNAIGMARLTKFVIPVFKKQKSGQIINMSSIAAKAVHQKSEFYAASKSAVLEYSEGLRQEVKKYGVKVATICPGNVETKFWDKKEIKRRKKENWHGKMPTRLSPYDIAKVVDFICNQSDICDIQDVAILPFS